MHVNCPCSCLWALVTIFMQFLMPARGETLKVPTPTASCLHGEQYPTNGWSIHHWASSGYLLGCSLEFVPIPGRDCHSISYKRKGHWLFRVSKTYSKGGGAAFWSSRKSNASLTTSGLWMSSTNCFSMVDTKEFVKFLTYFFISKTICMPVSFYGNSIYTLDAHEFIRGGHKVLDLVILHS